MPKQSNTAKKAKKAVNKAARKSHSIIEDADEKARQVKHRAHVTTKKMKYKAVDAAEKTEQWIKDNPVKAAVGAVAVGVVLAKLFGGKKKK